MSQPCLPVPRQRKRKEDEATSSLVDFSSIDIQSIDASEYLSMVSQQAKSMPEVFVAAEVLTDQEKSSHHGNDDGEFHQDKKRRSNNHDEETKKRKVIPIDGSAASLLYLISNRASLTSPPSNDYLPRNPIWEKTTLANFERLRKYIEQCRTHGIGGKDNRVPVPSMKDRSGWHVFCVGDNEASGNAGAYFDDGDGDGDDNEHDGNDKNDNSTIPTPSSVDDEEIPEWRKPGVIPPEGHTPTVSLVCQMDQVMVRRVLSHLSYYVREGWSPATPQKSAWIYTLLARLERPIHRDDAANLFGLLKTLTQVRASMKVDDIMTTTTSTTKEGSDDRTYLARLNVLILLIGVYFEQGGGTSMARQE